MIDYIGRRGFLIISFFLAIPFAIACAMLAPNLRDKGESTGFFWSVMAMKCLVRGRFFVIVLLCVLLFCCCFVYFVFGSMLLCNVQVANNVAVVSFSFFFLCRLW